MTRTWIAIFTVFFVWSALAPHDRLTWLLEVFPAIAAIAVLAATRRTFPLTPLAYWLLLFECIVLMIGGHYTYAHVPLFDWISEYFQHGRNNYDKLAHLSQGFVPAIAVREVLLRLDVLRRPRWLFFIVTSICLAISALYELIEWGVAMVSRQAAESFLGTQGYEWDTQSDMALALLGAMLAQWLLARRHDRQMANLDRA